MARFIGKCKPKHVHEHTLSHTQGHSYMLWHTAYTLHWNASCSGAVCCQAQRRDQTRTPPSIYFFQVFFFFFFSLVLFSLWSLAAFFLLLLLWVPHVLDVLCSSLVFHLYHTKQSGFSHRRIFSSLYPSVMCIFFCFATTHSYRSKLQLDICPHSFPSYLWYEF